MIQTSSGLPNTCSQCGRKVASGIWYAENEDRARAGVGICSQCAKPEPPPAPEIQPEPAAAPEKKGKRK